PFLSRAPAGRDPAGNPLARPLLRQIAARRFSTAWKTFFHGVEKMDLIFPRCGKIGQSFYVLRNFRRKFLRMSEGV
ncbi:MAG TPA: hypothetical protein PKK12_06600, partial [Candidatus Aminicenantes bacterium]|nr:hypothetical protein [Candidatus Aminicenantes bacterium]